MAEETKVFQLEDGWWLVDARAIAFETEKEALEFCDRCDLTPVEYYSGEVRW